MKKALEAKWQKLLKIIKKYPKPLLALSGGLDSSFLTFAISEAEVDATTATIVSELFSQTETKRAKNLSKNYNIHHLEISFSGKHHTYLKENPVDRCYTCKKILFMELKNYADKEDFTALFDGTTYDDLTKHRPGLKAKVELGVISPLAEAKICKEDLKDIARHFNLDFAELPSFSCLATRFPYGEKLNLNKLSSVEKAEKFLLDKGFEQIRVRSHNNIARIEVYPNDFEKIIELQNEVIAYLKDLGFTYITLDLEGFRSGSMDI